MSFAPFESVPRDVAWLILREVIWMERRTDTGMLEEQFMYNTSAQCPCNMAVKMIMLAGVNTEWKRILRSKCKWDGSSSWTFKRGSFDERHVASMWGG